MRYTALLFLASPLACSQIPVSVPEPVRAVNFTRETNACYIASALQAVIALKPWREYIFSYPPATSCVYDKDLLKALQTFINNYAIISTTSDVKSINLNPLYRMMQQKSIVTHCKFDDPLDFLKKLNTGLTKAERCDIFDIFKFSITETMTTDKTSESQLITPEPIIGISGRSLFDGFKASFNFKVDNVNVQWRFISPPNALCIHCIQDETFGKDFSASIQPNIDIAQLCQDTAQLFTRYKLKSVLWRSKVHLIVYVTYGNSWYLCDDLKPACSIPQNAPGDLKRGNITYGDWGVFYPLICLYERILPSPPAPTDAFIDLNSSLQLLGMS